MRRVTLALLLAALLAVPMVAAAPPEATLSGRVATADGAPATDGLVLAEPIAENVIRDASNGHAVPESLRRLGHATPQGLRAFETDDEGNYEGSPTAGTYRVVAVADGRVSRLHTVSLDGPTTRNLSVADAHLPRVNATGATAERGESATVAFRVHNADDVPIRNLTVRVPDREALPVQQVASPTGSVDGRAVRFDRVTPGGTALVRVTVEVTDLRRTDLRVTATSDTHLVADTDGATVRRSDVTERTTRTALPVGGDGRTTSDGANGGDAGETTGTERPTGNSGPGFGPVLALVAVLAAAALALRR